MTIHKPEASIILWIMLGAAMSTAIGVASTWLGLVVAIFCAMAGGLWGLAALAAQARAHRRAERLAYPIDDSIAVDFPSEVETPPRAKRVPCRPTLKSRVD